LIRRIAVAGPVIGNVAATTGAAGCFGIGLKNKLLATVPPRTVIVASVLIFMLAPRIAFNLTVVRCGTSSGLTNVVEP
jgi:hypothetical protein